MVELVLVVYEYGISVWSTSEVNEVFAVSGWVCWDDDMVLNDVFTVDCEAGMALKERAISREGFLKSDGEGFIEAGTCGLLNGCFPFEIFVNFGDFSASWELSEGRLRLLACKERWALASTRLMADLEVTDGDGDLDSARSDGGVTNSSSSSSVGDPGSGTFAR